MNRLDLDDQKAVASLDAGGMLAAVSDFPRQCKEAAAIAAAATAEIKPLLKSVRNVLVLGMGGSGISGDILRALLASEAPLPLAVNKSSKLPAYVSKNTLVFAVSYSGNTAETLAATEAAAARGAQIISVTSGGRLAARARAAKQPLVLIPGGRQPRAALGYLAVTLYVLAKNLILEAPADDEATELATVLAERRSSWSVEAPLRTNIAKQTALKLAGRVPVIYGESNWPAAAALRWKCQFNENSKVPAFHNQLPELDHNEIMGWNRAAAEKGDFYLIILRDNYESRRTEERLTVVRDLIAPAFSGVSEFYAVGESKLSRFFSLTYLGDFVSTYLALADGVDPTPVDRIEQLKAALKEGG